MWHHHNYSIEDTADKALFIEEFKKDVTDFRAQVNRVKKQYHELRTLKQNLPDSSVIMQMDFRENFSCRSLFNKRNVQVNGVPRYYPPIQL